jgi:AcrR family transcriptional regulator
MTREESRDQTRHRLLDAASTVIAEKGLAAASVEDIAAQAGYTRGAFYSNFEDKGSLLLALLVREQERIAAELQAMLQAEQAPEDFERAVLAYYLAVYRNSDCFMSWIEAKLLAVRDPVFRKRMKGALIQTHLVVAGFVTAYRERTGRHSSIPAHQIALGLISLCEGMQFAHMTDPDTVPGEMVEAVLSQYFEASILNKSPGGASLT